MNRKKNFIIKRTKLKNLSTSKEMFKYLFQNQIKLNFLDDFAVSEDTPIDFNSDKGKSIYKKAIEIIGTIISKYGKFKIHTDHLKLTPINFLG